MARALIDTYAQLPLELVSGLGSRVTAADGRTYWDFYGGHAVCILGHSHPDIAAALHRQAAQLTFYSNVVPLAVRTRAAEALLRFAAGNDLGTRNGRSAEDDLSAGDRPAGRGFVSVFFCNSGAEANENALKLAIQQTGRRRLAALHGGWHGRTLLTLSATTDEKLTRPLAGLLMDCLRLRPNEAGDLALLDESVAAFLVEPIMSIAGVIALTEPYLAALRRRCDEVGAYLIYDEVQTGVGRLGRPFVAGTGGVWPEMSTSAKSLANGVPIGAVLMSRRVAGQVHQGDLGSTFGGGPLACAALLATLAALTQEGLLARAEQLGAWFRTELAGGLVTEVRGRGGLIGLRLGRPAKPVQEALLARGIITGTSAASDVLRLMPPINIPDEALDALRSALRDLG